MNPKITDELIRKYLRQECTQEENELIENWLVDPKNRARVNWLMKSQWGEINPYNLKDDINAHELLNKVHSAIGDQKTVLPHHKSRPWYNSQWVRIAAILLIPILSIGLYYALDDSTRDLNQITYSYFENEPGRRSKINLPDGSTVWLNADSKLSFPSRFLGDVREVSLEGEAFFDVVENQELPFIVKTVDINVRVLGTTFNVSAFPEEPTVETTLVTGSVALKKLGSDEDFLRLEPNQKAFYSKLRQSFSIHDVDPSYSTSWKEGSLKFHNSPFGEVVKKLERWYGVEIQYEQVLKDGHHLTFTLTGESLEKILELMGSLIPIEYNLEGKQVKINSK